MRNKNIKAGFGMPLGMKIALIALAARMGIAAEEIYNKPVVEYFERVIGETGEALVGVDEDGDGVADMFIVMYPLKAGIIRRLANFVKTAGIISYEDKDKQFSPSFGAYSLSRKGILEIGGRSVLEIFPNSQLEFPYEAARQERLQSQNGGR